MWTKRLRNYSGARFGKRLKEGFWINVLFSSYKLALNKAIFCLWMPLHNSCSEYIAKSRLIQGLRQGGGDCVFKISFPYTYNRVTFRIFDEQWFVQESCAQNFRCVKNSVEYCSFRFVIQFWNACRLHEIHGNIFLRIFISKLSFSLFQVRPCQSSIVRFGHSITKVEQWSTGTRWVEQWNAPIFVTVAKKEDKEHPPVPRKTLVPRPISPVNN